MKPRRLAPLFLFGAMVAAALFLASLSSRKPGDTSQSGEQLSNTSSEVPRSSPSTPESNHQASTAQTQAAPPARSSGTTISKRPAVPARLVIGSAWKNESDPQLSAFSSWTDRYLEATETDRPKLLVEGSQLARQRREALAQLIREDPELALAAAVPLAVRERLPAGITALLEERVSGRGELSLNAVTPAPGQTVTEPMFRSALVNGHEYRAFTYGRRAKLATLPDVSLNGIAVGKLFAVSDSPLRVLETGETADNRTVNDVCVISGKTTPTTIEEPLNVKEPTAVELNGQVHVLCDPSHVLIYESHLEANERSHQINDADGQPGSSGVSGRPTQSWTHGTKTVLIIRVEFPDLPGTPVNPNDGQTITEDYAVNRFNIADGVRDYFEQASYGKTSLQISPAVAGDSPDVTGVLLMPLNSVVYATNGDNSTLHQHARAAAQSAGFDVASYDRVGVVFANLASIPGSLITYGGLANVTGNNFWINGYYVFNIVAHEIGHNYGLRHANLWQVADGNPVSQTGSSIEYGDIFDIMGDGDFLQNHFSHWNKSILQWIPDTAVLTITNGGTYRVFRFDDQAAKLTNALALKIVRDATRDYWIGHRRATSNPGLDNGAYVLWGYNANQPGDLLDMTTPGTSVGDAALAVGATFNDTAGGIILHPVARGGSGADEWVDVQVTFQPRFQWARTTIYADEGSGIATLTVTRNNNSVGAASVNFTTVSGTATSPADFTGTNGTLSWTDGDASPKVISIPLVSNDGPEGTEQFSVRLSNPSGGVIVGSSNATVLVTEPGTFDPEFVPRFINSEVKKVISLPDGKVLAAGAFFEVWDQDNNSYTRGGIAQFTSSGNLDTNFLNDGGGIAGGIFQRVEDMARQPDGKILIAGDFTSVNGTARNNIARLNIDGSLDTSFDPGTGANNAANTVLVQPDGKVLVGGQFTSFNGTPREYLARLNANGSLDTGFVGPDFAQTSGLSVHTIALQPDRKVLVGGFFYFPPGLSKSGICRVNTNGTLDSTFNGVVQGAQPLGNPATISSVLRIVPQLDGKILIAGEFGMFNTTARRGVARLSSTGALDSFAPTTDGDGEALFIQPDGKILLGGSFSTVNGAPAQRFVRLTSAGANDPTFAAANGPSSDVLDFALQSDGRVVFGGQYGGFQGHTNVLWRFFSGIPALPGTIQWSADAAIGVEGTNAILAATRVGGSAGALSVNFATVADTATSADFTGTNGTLSWTNGETAVKTIFIPITADALNEGAESFIVNLGSPLMESTLLGAVQQATVSIYTRYGAWQATNFTTLELANPLISGDAADPDNDGVKNVLEYAFGLSPNTPDTSDLPSGSLQNVTGTNYLALTFRRRVPQLDLTYTPRAAGSLLGPWSSGLIQVGSPVNNGDGMETVTFRDTVPVPSTSQRFMRVEVTRTP